MKRTFDPLVVLVVLGAGIFASSGMCQTPDAAPPATTEPAQANPLPGLPHPPDVPQAVLQQPGAAPYTCQPLVGPYFQPDPLLDPPSQPLGWFADTELAIVGPHVKNRLRDLVTVDGRPPDLVHLGSADLDWTASPRFDLGYRLPAGFGEFVLGYRFLVTDGTQTTPGLDASESLRSRLDINEVSLDYASREFFTEQWPWVHMKWFFGLRYDDVYFDSHAMEPVAAAAAGSGIFDTRVTNRFWGIGPHVGVELTRSWCVAGLSWVARVDGTCLFGRTRQLFTETSTTLGPDGLPLTGNTRESNPEAAPIINMFAGLTWRPPTLPHASFSAGYVYEYWWDVGRLSTTFSRGEISDQGVILRAEFSF